MKVTFGQQTTKVKQLADLLSQEISMGKYKSNCTLPSINKLSREYQVSRDTVFKAFIDLKDRGIIDSTPGKGYYVTNKLTNIGSPDKPGGLSIQLCKSEKKEFYIRYSS